MGKKTPLYLSHLAANAKMVDFAGWDMPLHYGSQVQEHHYVRRDAGMFDVSHMTIVDVKGQDVIAYLHYLLANNIDKLIPGKAFYTCMLNNQGGVVDDLIVYKIADDFYRLVVNSATRDKDLNWLNEHAKKYTIMLEERTDLAILAIQGCKVKNKITAIFNPEDLRSILALKPFHFVTIDSFFIARTGYTGEDGFEIIVPAKAVSALWERLITAQIHPCGLGARDTLRLEAGLNLYGTDMDEKVTPLESNLGWTVAWEPKERHFIGRQALEKQQQQGVTCSLVGLILRESGVLRNHQKVKIEGGGEGEITSGSFSPTLNKGIALARVPITIGTECQVEIRGKQHTAQVIKPPFVRQGQINEMIID
ncbi:MAG: gcvT [Gammaproteobacteria bacterium]|jgi:aminomethyltransferase|nr:gcvT [Gammaproteobacteria bacterium]